MFKDFVYLYVEDDALSREALTVILQRVMQVDRLFVFEDSTDFMARVKALPHKPDLILLDIHMQPINGFEMLAQLRQDPDYAKARIIALTAGVLDEEMALLKKNGFNGMITKPISVGQFPVLIARVLKGEDLWPK
jgi:CheY-like chemotaxis protein